MTRELHIFTVGVSLLARLSKDLERAGEWIKLPPDDPRQDEVEEAARPGVPEFDAALKALRENPRLYSAELNSFYGFVNLRGTLLKDVEVLLLSTDTGTGWFCASAVKHHLQEASVPLVRLVKVKSFGLGYLYFEDALANLLDAIAAEVETAKRRGLRVYVNATGGLKPESAFAVMAAFLFGADAAYYIHEAFKEVVIIHPLPFILDTNFLKELLSVDGKHAGEHLVLHHRRLGVLSLEDLKDRGLVSVEQGRVVIRKWVKELAKYAHL